MVSINIGENSNLNFRSAVMGKPYVIMYIKIEINTGISNEHQRNWLILFFV